MIVVLDETNVSARLGCGLALASLMMRVVDRVHYPRLATLLYSGGLPVAGRSGTLAARPISVLP